MPRQDVPYGGAICRLRERIAEIFDKLGEKLHTINGVPGDGDGNVKIVSGSSAVVINNDPTQNEIAVSLDTSQLPAAAVSSVNGQTGAVALDAGDIPTVGGDVQADLQNLANDISGNTAAINAEVLARQGADSTLQTNINNITASLPSQVVAAVAADPTIALLVSADSDNVKLTGNQSIGGIKTVNTEATGTFSQQIANSQKIKAELDNYAFMVRTVNAQNIAGDKNFLNEVIKRVSGNYSRCFTTAENIFEETNNPTEQRTAWPLIVANNAFTKFPFRIAVSQDTNGALLAGIELYNLHTNNFASIRIICPKTGACSLQFYNGTSWITIA